jgi:hypothetical protein
VIAKLFGSIRLPASPSAPLAHQLVSGPSAVSVTS